MTHRGLASLGFAVWAVALVPSTSASHAQSYEQCKAKSGGNTMSLKECDGAELGRRETVLNRLYKQLLHAADHGRQAGLRKAERAWVAFADSECRFRYSGEADLTDAPLVSNACRLELIARRTDDLRRQLEIEKLLGKF